MTDITNKVQKLMENKIDTCIKGTDKNLMHQIDELISIIPDVKNHKIEMDNADILILTDKDTANKVLKILTYNSQIKTPFILLSNTKKLPGTPNGLVMFPDNKKMAIWHNGNAYNYAVYDAQNKLINSSDGFDAPPYKDVRNGIIQSVDNAIGYKPSGGGFDMVHILAKIKKSYKIRELKDKIWSSIKYNPETHLCRMLKDELFIINKETGKIDNPYDYANISLKNYFITYRNYTDGTCMTSATEDINSGIPQNPEKKIDINDDNPISFGLK